MTQQPASGPPRMPNPAADTKAERRDMRRLGALLLAEMRHQTVLLDRLVQLGEANKAALDKLQEGEPDAFSVRGLGQAEEGGPFIGG